MQQKKSEKDDLKAYRVGGKLTIMQFMALLAVLGIVATIILRKFFTA